MKKEPKDVRAIFSFITLLLFIFFFALYYFGDGVFTESVSAAAKQERLEEIKQIEDILMTKWANREVREKLDGIDTRKKVRELKKYAGADLLTYSIAIKRMTKSLHDDHLWSEFPIMISQDSISKKSRGSGFEVRGFKEGYFLTQCLFAPYCQELSFPLRILRIDGRPMDEWFEKEMVNIGASTPESRKRKALDNLRFHLDDGKNSPPQKITLQLQNGEERMLKIFWYSGEEKKYPFVEYAQENCVDGMMTPEKTFVLSVNTFSCTQANGTVDYRDYYKPFFQALDKALAKIDNPDSMLVDVRKNGGGDDTPSEAIFNLLLDKPTVYYISSFLNKEDEWEKRGGNGEFVMFPNEKYRSIFKNLPVALLAGGQCMSACSIFVAAVRDNHLAPILGENVQVGVGSRKFYTLPSGNQLAVPFWKVWGANGERLEGRIIEVDHEILPSIEDYRQKDVDVVLQKAIDFLQKERTAEQ